MAYQSGEPSYSKAPMLDPTAPLISPLTNPQVPYDPSVDLEVAYAALEITDDEPDEFTLAPDEDLRFALVGKLITDKTIKFSFMRDTMATVWRPESPNPCQVPTEYPSSCYGLGYH
nr:uncharacterized protein LOC109167503 [Ipomoea trifida]